MKRLVYLLCLLPLGLFSQIYPYAVVPNNQNGNIPEQPDTQPAPVKQGVIKVRKPSVRPYFKCEYYLTLARVSQVEMLVEAPNGEQYRELMPVFDSGFSEANERVYPLKSEHFSKKFVEQIEYSYAFEDTASVDTMRVQMWIGKNGKVRWKNPDTSYNGNMPHALEMELYSSVMSLTEWGTGGGYMTPKKFLRKQKRMAENYYCVLYIIASAKPLTAEQKSTGSRYAPFDIPLNSPPGDEQEKDFIEGNRHPKDDSLTR